MGSYDALARLPGGDEKTEALRARIEDQLWRWDSELADAGVDASVDGSHKLQKLRTLLFFAWQETLATRGDTSTGARLREGPG